MYFFLTVEIVKLEGLLVFYGKFNRLIIASLGYATITNLLVSE